MAYKSKTHYTMLWKEVSQVIKRLLRLFYDRIIFFLLPVKYSTEGFYSNPGLFCPFKAAFDCISANGMGYNSCLPSTKLCPAT